MSERRACRLIHADRKAVGYRSRGPRDDALCDRLRELAAKPRKGQIWIKRVVAEMGGKDAIIVDCEADLESAATGVVQSAYGYQGQKCSACSRAIVDEAVNRHEFD